MIEKDIEVGMFARRVLRCVKEIKLTSEEIWESYKKLYPQSFIAKAINLHEISLTRVEATLHSLAKEDFVHKEATNFTDEALEKETEVFWISNKGRKFLLPKK